MRAVVWFTLLFAVAVVAATTLGTNDGLVSFYWRGWRMDVSLNLFLLVLVGTCFAIVRHATVAGGAQQLVHVGAPRQRFVST